jgi:tetratricopeptide (TPR) repeat protein
LLARKLDQCIEQAHTALEVDPNMTLSFWTLGTAYEQQGKYQEAVETYEKGIALGGALVISRALIARAQGKSGDRERAWGAIRELQELSKTRYVCDFGLAIIYEGLMEKDLAIKALERACENRETNLIQMKAWPHLDNLRDDPRFQEIERRVGLRK